MPLVRSLTFFIPIHDWYSNRLKEEVENFIYKSFDIADKLELSPWTIRFVFPPIPREFLAEDTIKIANIMLSFDFEKNVLLQIFPLTTDSKCMKNIIDILNLYDNVYSTVLVNDDYDINDLVDNVYLKDTDPNVYTRISITYGDWVETAYFPSSANARNRFGYSISLRYIDVFSEYLAGNETPLLEFLKDIKNKTSQYSDYFYGVDYSLSPWMEESVGRLIEEKYHVTIGDPGTYSAVYKINRVINKIIKKKILSSIGFNEVMLPVGEDNLLKKRVEDKKLRLGLLEGLSSICVAGLDMVAIKKNESVIRGVLHDLFSIYMIKKRPIGLRIIPVDKDSVNLKRFGYIPTIAL